MDKHSVSAQLEKLRAEIAALRYQAALYQQTKCHSYPELAHDKREQRLIEIKAELEQLYGRASPRAFLGCPGFRKLDKLAFFLLIFHSFPV